MNNPTPVRAINPLLESALALAARGFRIIPLHNLTAQNECSCQTWRRERGDGQECHTPGKHPRLGEYAAKATTDKGQIRRWWAGWPKANIGIITGKESGIWALDKDPRNGGDQSRDSLVYRIGQLPYTMTTRTGGGGTHEYFRWPKDLDLPFAMSLGEDFPGLDILGEGHMLVAPPSYHVTSGRNYAWEPELSPDEQLPVDAPPALLALLKARIDAQAATAIQPSGQKPRAGFPLADVGRILAGCAWMRHCSDDARLLGEPEWYAQLSILGRCENGESLAHDLSSPHAGYNASATTAKLRHAVNDAGPVTCGRVRHSLGGSRYCDSCEHAGKLKSPVVLGIARAAVIEFPPPPAAPWPEDCGAVAGQNPPVPPRGGEGRGAEPPEDGHSEPPDLISYPLTDSGNGERIVAMFGKSIRYCTEMKSWFLWDGRRWAVDHSNVMRQKANEMARLLYLQAVQLPEGARRTQIDKHARASESSRGITNALVEAERMPGIPVSAQALDQMPDHLNFLNGTVHLRDGALLPHDRSMLLTKIVEYDYDPQAKAPIFQAFVEWTMGCTNPEAELTETTARLVQFVQRVIGYCITGAVSEKAIFVFYGADGDNGKTTLLTLFREILGRDYASLLLIDTIMHARSTDNTAREDMADLRGARFVQTSEVGKEDRLNEQRIKFLTQGMGTIKSRRLHEHLVEFVASHKLLMDCNYRPKVQGQDNAIWRRLIQIPFTMTIAEDKKDGELRNKMKAEAAGVLAWAVRGAIEWYKNGLGKPPEVSGANQDWREHDDPLREFLSDWCEVGEKLVCPVSDLMTAYLLWAKEYGEKFPLARRNFNEALVSKGIKQDKKRLGGEPTRIWVGVELKPIATQKLGKWQGPEREF